jgi:[ribosomal protein S18]-alanine N-acetyltransferase
MIRAARLEDLSEICDIAQNSATAAHWDDSAYGAILNGQNQRRTLLVAEENGQIIGFAVAANICAEWELENIVVAEQFRCRGIGAQLLGAVIECARDAGAVEIHAEVRESNPALSGFYKQLGFNEIGRRTKYYANPSEDAILIRLLISRP